MVHKINKTVLLLLLLCLQGCSAVGFVGTNDPRTLLSQGFELEKMNRLGTAESHYFKALRLAKEKDDETLVAAAKYYLGMFYRNPGAYDAQKSISYLKESLKFYGQDAKRGPIASNMYTALTEVYDKEGDKKNACYYLKKAQNTYIKKIIPNPLWNKPEKGYTYFFNPVRNKYPFKKFDELIDYYDQQLGCGVV